MGLEESLRQLDTHVVDGDFSIDISFNCLERNFDDRNRILMLYSDIAYKTENFSWESTIPTVKIPYRDPSIGFLIEGVIFSSVGVYSRAPGIVPDVEKRTLKERIVEEPKVEIVTARNSTISIGYKRSAVQITFKRNDREHSVPIGVFLKALSGLPYKEILKGFAYKPQMLLNGFPCSLPKGQENLAKADTYGIESEEEPFIDECVDAVYAAITQIGGKHSAKYSTHWKVNRINSLLTSMHFKTRQKYEATLAVGHRAVGTYLDQDIDVPYFSCTQSTKSRLNRDGTVSDIVVKNETVEHFRLPRGHYITDADAKEIRRYDIDTLRVRTTRSFVLQEQSPILFRAKGYKLVKDLPEIDAHSGDIIDDALLAKINDTDLSYLEVYTPNGRKVLHRSGEAAELGDFYTILNYLFTHVYTQKSDSSQYEVSNRVIFDYERQVRMEVEQTYNDIISAVIGSAELKHLLAAFPTLPSTNLISYLRNARNKEIAQADITNIMSRAISDTKASAGMHETPAEMMPVQRGQYGRLDSFHAPDSDKVGSVQQKTVLAKISEETGEIEAPYERIDCGRPTGEIVYLTAEKENKKYIAAWNEDFSKPVIMARYNGDITTVERDKVEYRDPSPFCDMSVSRMCIPFPGFSQPKRALMATKMNGQAIPVLFPERPLVSTGADTEVPCLYYTGRDIIESNNLKVDGNGVLELVGHEWKKNFVEYQFVYNGMVLLFSVPFTATDKESLYHYNLNLVGSKCYGPGDIVFYHQCCDIREYDYWTRINQGALPLFKDHTKPAMALGVNLRVCFKTYGSSTIDDAILISDRLITDNVLTNIQIFKYEYELRQNESFSDTAGIVKLHSHVYKGQPVISLYHTGRKGVKLKEIPCTQEGEVVYSVKSSDASKAEVWVATFHTAEVGDKVAGRYGDKSVIAKIVPEWMMPYDPATGETMDVVLSPLGMPSRMNYGRILEVALGGAMAKNGKHAVITPFYPGIKGEITEEYASAGLQPKKLFNPVYGKYTERPVMTGVLYMMKLEQMSNLKISAVGYPTAVDPVFGQPVDSILHDKGQAIGEMESWALFAAGAQKALDKLFTIYAGDEAARKAYFAALEENADNPTVKWDESELESSPHSTNKNALVTQTVMRMFGCDLDTSADNSAYVLTPLDMRDIPVQVTQEEFINGHEITGDTEWFTVPLSAPVINPFWVEHFPLNLVLGIKSVKTLIAGTAYLDLNLIDNRAACIVPAKEVQEHSRMHMITGIEAVITLVKSTTVQEAIARLRVQPTQTQVQSTEEAIDITSAETLDGVEDYDRDSDLGDLSEVPINVADVLRFLGQLRESGRTLSALIWYVMPIMPRIFRQSNIVDNREHEHSFQVQLKSICSSRATSQGIYDSLRDLIGYGKPKQENLVSIRGYFFGKGSTAGNHGRVRNSVLSKRVGFSGRVVITPMEDPNISPFFIGLPWRVVMIELARPLAMQLYKARDSITYAICQNSGCSEVDISSRTISDWQAVVETLGEFNPYILGKLFPNQSEADLYFIFNYLRGVVRGFVEGKVRKDGTVWHDGEWVDPATLPMDTTLECAMVLCGRQPTLHKKSIRSYFLLLVDGYSMRIHPIVCKAYNADFDGDQMWHAQLFGECKMESFHTTSILQDLISEKDGEYTLELSQDVALGMYCATSFANNAAEFQGGKGQFYFFDNVDELRCQLEYGDMHFYDAVVFKDTASGNYYCSTAGRILANLLIPGTLTQRPFSDTYGICEKVLGAEYKSHFKELLYDTVWTTTSIKAEGRSNGVKLSTIMLNVYTDFGDRASVMAAQAIYEMGVMASDVYSVTMSLDDMSSSVNVEAYMDEPRNAVTRLNSLYQLGLITNESRKLASVRAWDFAKKSAQHEIINSLDPNSNTFYMMYSGARGKPDQVMQSVGFIGNISKTKEVDIEYPILSGYGSGLSSFDLAQTAPSARIGVISTQAGTKETGYAGRQSVYMTSGLGVKEADCGIQSRIVQVEYDPLNLKVRYPDGETKNIDSLLGEFVDSDTEGFAILRQVLNLSGYMITQQVLDTIVTMGVHRVKLLDKEVELVYSITDTWRSWAEGDLYSYALPFTDNMKVTKETVDWIEMMGLVEVIAFEKREFDQGSFFDREAYLPVEYDTMRYSMSLDGQPISNEALYTLTVSEDTPNFHYYRNLLTVDGGLTEKAIAYLSKKRVREILFKDGRKVVVKYEISDLFRNLTLGRIGRGLPYLDDEECITPETLNLVEELQLEYIPVRTSLTCLSSKGICAHCYGKSLSTNKFHNVGDNLGIAASEAMTEPLSQATLNVAHSGGKRSAGTGLVSGLDYYKKMLRGAMVTKHTNSLLEGFAPCSGYVKQNKHNKSFIQIVCDDDSVHSIELDDDTRLNVPDGAYIDKGDTLIAGLPDLNRYSSTEVFDSAIKTRYLLLREYNKIFSALQVSARNAEIMARAQTSVCYAHGKGANSKTKDTAVESANPTGNYILRVSSQAQVVNTFSGIAGYGFEQVANMILMELFTPEGLPLNSVLGNLITGTPVGSTEAKFISKFGDGKPSPHHRSSVRTHMEELYEAERNTSFNNTLSLMSGQQSGGYSISAESDVLSRLLGESEDIPQALPSFEDDDPMFAPLASEPEETDAPTFETEIIGVEEEVTAEEEDLTPECEVIECEDITPEATVTEFEDKSKKMNLFD